MTVPTHSGVFAAITHHFDNLALGEVILSVTPNHDGGGPLHLPLTEARITLHEPDSSPALGAAIWRSVLAAALAEREPSDVYKLAVIWLTIPQLTGTVHRVCMRLRADQADVESEMVLTILEELQTADQAESLSPQALIKRARSRAWHFARQGLQERATDRLENISEDCRLALINASVEDLEVPGNVEVEVTRPAGRDGLQAPLRFRVSAAHVRQGLLRGIADDADPGRPIQTSDRRRTATLILSQRARQK